MKAATGSKATAVTTCSTPDGSDTITAFDGDASGGQDTLDLPTADVISVDADVIVQ